MNKILRITACLCFIICCLFSNSDAFRSGRYRHRHHHRHHHFYNQKHHQNASTVLPDLWFTQKLDHLNPENTDTWQQRYWMQDAFFGGECHPVYLVLGWEGAEDPYQLMVDYEWTASAKEHKALLFLLEHRFYGQSHPTPDLSLPNLVYLTTKQVLADAANFVDSMNSRFQLKRCNKWVAWGRSYSGQLAAYIRLKYPNLIHTAVASSAPVAITTNYPQYFEVVKESLDRFSPPGKSCSHAVQQATRQLKEAMETTEGRKNLVTQFGLCGLNDVVQYNLDNNNYTNGYPIYSNRVFTVEVVCQIMTNSSIGDPMARLAKFNRQYNALNGIAPGMCNFDPSYDNYLAYLRNTSWDAVYNGDRQYLWLCCVEGPEFQTTDSRNQPYEDTAPLWFVVKSQCTDPFGPKYDLNFIKNATRDINIYYGGSNIQATRVIYVNGELDPCSRAGFTKKSPNSNSEVVFIHGASHVADTYPASDSDSLALKKARVKINTLLIHYLSQKD